MAKKKKEENVQKGTRFVKGPYSHRTKTSETVFPTPTPLPPHEEEESES